MRKRAENVSSVATLGLELFKKPHTEMQKKSQENEVHDKQSQSPTLKDKNQDDIKAKDSVNDDCQIDFKS
jgi:hypothetical protein